MARDWEDIINDPEPAILFKPMADLPEKSSFSKNSIQRSFRSISHKVNSNGSQLIRLVLFSGLICSISAGFATEWFRYSDVWVSGLIGLLVSTCILILPELMISIGTGAIIALYCSTTFVPFSIGGYRLYIYFLFGFVFSWLLQIAKRKLYPKVLSDRNMQIKKPDSEIEIQ